jgi:hypothetical protein
LGVVTAGVAGALLPIGNVSKLALAVAEESKELLDYTSPGGGTQNKIVRIKSIEAALTLHDVSPDNVALALRGTSSAVTTATVTAESIVGYKGALVPFAFLPSLTDTITITHTSGSPTYVKDTDYTITRAGIVVLTAGAITDAQALKATYTKKPAHAIEGLVSSGSDYRLILNGLNEAQSGKAVSLTLYRVKFSPTSGLDFISDDFNKMEVKGAVLQNTYITGTGLSQYVKIVLED